MLHGFFNGARTPCANTQYLNAYQAEQEAGERRSDWVVAEALRRLEAMKPFSRDQIDEALGEVLNRPDHPDHALLLAAFAGTDGELGVAVRKAVSDYWLGCCESQAEDAYDDGAAALDADYLRDAAAERDLFAI